MELAHDLGFNVIKRMVLRALESDECDELECMAYNVSLDFILKLFRKYSSLKKVSIWSNTNRITFSEENRSEILDFVEKKKINFFHISENLTPIHGKLYAFKKNKSIQFLAVGSPNLTENSNHNFESLIYVEDRSLCEEILSEIPQLYTDLNFSPETTIPIQLDKIPAPEITMDPKFLDGLWKHQSEIVMWLANKRLSIVNIPPGTGKTKIAFTYLRYMFERDLDLTAIVLVPTTTLVTQWQKRLTNAGISNLEWGTDLSGLGSYFADPGLKVLVTLYSRFFKQYREYQKRAKIIKPNLLLVLDECHNSYGHIEDLLEFKNIMESFGGAVYGIGLSATIDSFKEDEVRNFINIMGGNANRFEISLQRFYSYWNMLNSTKVLKPINYTPIKYCLTAPEMEELKEFSKKIAIQIGKKTVLGPTVPTAAIKRARWLRGLPGGVITLKNYIMTHMDYFSDRATIIFVQTNKIAEDLRDFITKQPGWNPEASAYVYDSSKNEDYLSYALTQFKKHLGFCLISEKMLSEGFDLPKVDRVILHGSDKSPRDWIQKIGRALRYDKETPNSIAEIVDVVFCDPVREPLSLEKERYECLTAISN